MNITERLKLLIEDLGYNPKSFAYKIGIAQRTFNYYVNGRDPSYEAIHAILYTFPDVSAEWLTRGEGEMYISEGLPKFRGNETEAEEDLHAVIAQLRGKLKRSEENNVKLMGQLEFMEDYNMKVVGWLNEARKKLEKAKENSPKSDVD